MKKIIFALVVLLSVQFANAQVKSAATAKKAVESAKAASQDPKKAPKVATWLKLSKSYMDAYNSPKGNGLSMLGMGVGQTEVALQLAGDKPLAVENVVLAGEPYIKEVYQTRDYLYNKNGQFVMIIVTKPVLEEDVLAGALEAYKKAYEVDVKQSKIKDIKEGIAEICESYLQDGMNAYMLGDLATASKYFGLAAEASLVEPYNTLNAEAFYNAGYTAFASGNVEQAKSYYEKCLENNYHHENGAVYSNLANIYNQYAQNEDAKAKEPEAALEQMNVMLYYLDGKVHNFKDQVRRDSLNVSDIELKGRRATKQDLAAKAKFKAEMVALADSIVKANAEIQTLKKDVEKTSAVVAEYKAAADAQREIARDLLEQGFAKYPQSQVILIGLINSYLESKQDPSRLFELIAAAKANEPTNASLYYVEGNIYNELRQAEKDEAKKQEYFDSAVKAYDACVKVNPKFEYGYIGKGLLYFNLADIELKDKANNEMDEAKYAAIQAQIAQALKDSLVPFEEAYNVSTSNDLKVSIADYLMRIYYRMGDVENYKKYNEVVKTGQAN